MRATAAALAGPTIPAIWFVSKSRWDCILAPGIALLIAGAIVGLLA
jgi:hypothetical protein